jgi:hypothetical protein
MSKALKDFLSNFVVASAGAIVATTLFLLGRNLLVNHEYGLEIHLLLSIVVYTLLYSSLFALLHIGDSPTLGTTFFASILMVGLTNLFVFADEKFASLTIWTGLGQFVFALMLTAATYIYVCIERPTVAPKF